MVSTRTLKSKPDRRIEAVFEARVDQPIGPVSLNFMTAK
jgi:hypothetical protein